MDVRLPNGHIITNVLDDMSQSDLADLAVKNGIAAKEDFPENLFETSIPEIIGGSLLDLGIGTMRATKTFPDLAAFVLPDQITDPASEFFERGIAAAEALKPDAYRSEQQRTAIKRDAEGNFAGFQLPSAESVLGITLGSVPQIPLFLLGGGPLGAGITAGQLYCSRPVPWRCTGASTGGFSRNIVADFLLLDRCFPRSVHFCLIHAHESLSTIAGSATGTCRTRSEQQLGRLRSEMDYTSIDEVVDRGLHEYLNRRSAGSAQRHRKHDLRGLFQEQTGGPQLPDAAAATMTHSTG